MLKILANMPHII